MEKILMEYIGNIIEDRKLNHELQIVIFGFGKTGKQVYHILCRRGIGKKVVGICDNNSLLVGTNQMGFIVQTPEHIVECFPNAAYIVAGCRVGEMVCCLKQLHINRIHITRI